MPPAREYDVHFVNEFFDPQRTGYNQQRYLTAFQDPDDETRPLMARIEEIGLLEGRGDEVREALTGWFDRWPPAAAVQLVRVLNDAVSSDKRLLFVYRQTNAPVEVAVADFPTDQVVVVISGVHP
jgi:hypothetical protein